MPVPSTGQMGRESESKTFQIAQEPWEPYHDTDTVASVDLQEEDEEDVGVLVTDVGPVLSELL